MNRNYAIDNAKFLMIFTVIFGHLIEPMIHFSDLTKTLFMSIYSFHMPVFVILAGMLSTSSFSKQQIIKLFSSIIIPLIAFTIIYELFEIATTGHLSNNTRNFQPNWILWFLLSLFTWRAILPITVKFPYPITFSIIISLLIGYFDQIGYFLGLSRTIYFFPFFLIGHKLTSSMFSNKKLRLIPRWIYVLILSLNVVFFWAMKDFPTEVLLGSYSYKHLNLESWLPMGVRLGTYILSIITSISVLMLVPKTKFSISKLGSNSLYAYLWHGLIINIFAWYDLLGYIQNQDTWIALSILTAMAVVLTLVLSLDSIAEDTRRLILSPLKKIFRI